MGNAVLQSEQPGDIPALSRAPRGSGLRARRRLGGDALRAAHVMGWIALSSMVAAIFLSVVIALARGETGPLYITWISALFMTGVSGLIAAFIVVNERLRAGRTVVEAPPGEED